MTKSARNERLKITATWLNGVGIAAVAVGSFAPMAGWLITSSAVSAFAVAANASTWSVIGITLHLVARTVPKGLEE